MDVRSEIKSIIAKNATTLNQVCTEMSRRKNKKIAPNNITNKFARKTIKFEEIVDILNILDYHIEFVPNK